MTDTTMTGEPRGLRRFGRRTWLLLGVAFLLVTCLAVLAGTSLAWGASLREAGQLLPGTTIASVDVGDATLDEAIAAVDEQLAAILDRAVEVSYRDRRWMTSARELGATTDVEEVVAEAFDRTVAAGVTDLVRMRWAGGRADLDLDVRVTVPPDAAAAFVAAIADELDRDPRDARVRWRDDGLQLRDARVGRQVDLDAAADRIDAAVNGGAPQVSLPVDRLQPAVTTAAAQAAIDALGPLIDTALDRPVTATLDARQWTVTARDLGAVPELAPLLDAALAGDDPDADEVALDLPEGAVTAFVAGIAAEIDQPAQDAKLDWSRKRKRITPERNGIAVDRDAARAALRRGLEGGPERFDLRLVTVRPTITSDSFARALVVNHAERRLYLYEDDEVVRSWPVAVGLAGSPTPTGVFTVGAKRYEPTWYNPSPNGWGADMPARIGPGPDNPLGLRALNWHRNGRDTLIRFHGTPNEASIGEAASRGCVRMLNADVIELYDLVSTGTTIISIAS